MPGCAAPKCTSHSNKGFAFHRFPSDRERRKRWLISCRRAYWSPKPSDRLCSKHFEKSQYEQQRQDGKKLLKPFAVPTLFDVPNPPKKVVENRLQKRKKSALEEILSSSDNATGCEYCSDYKQEIQQLKNKITALETELENEKNKTHFLSDEQVQNASIGPKLIRKWSKEGIIMGLKMRYALGKNGYTFLRETGYPLPSYSTLNKRIQHIEIDFGILKSIIEMLKVKMSAMSDLEKDCSLMVDEMEISGDMDFDKSKKKFVGQVTLGDRNKRGNHLTVVALRGLNTPWKQIVAFHVTGQATTGLEMKNLILDVIHAVTQIGLRVRSIVSDMGANNKALWSELNIKVSRVHRLCQFNLMDEEISVFADAPHLLKNWKSALLSPEIFLPSDIVIEENLQTNEINGNYVVELFKIEANKDTNLRSLHHLTTDIVCPNQFSKMHVGNAMKFISFKTAAALEGAVVQKILPPAALSTAWFIRLLVQWFELVNSRKRASSITNRNFPSKEKFLNKFIDIIQGTVIKKGWKPLNTGSILSSLSFMKIAKSCITRGYKFLLGYFTRPTIYTTAYPTRPTGGYPTGPTTGYTRPTATYPTRPRPTGYPTRPTGYPTRPTGGYPTGPTGFPTRPTGGYPTGPTAGYPTRPTGGYNTGPTTGYPTRPTGGYPTGPTTGYPTRPTGYPTRPNEFPTGYPTSPTGSSTYPTPEQPGTEPTEKPGFPTAPPPGYRPSTFPTPGQPDTEPTERPGFPSAPPPGYRPSTQQPTGYPTEQPSTRYPTPGSTYRPTTGGPTYSPSTDAPSYRPSTPSQTYKPTTRGPTYTSNIFTSTTPNPDDNTIVPSRPSPSPGDDTTGSGTDNGGSIIPIPTPSDEDLRHPPHIHDIQVQCAKDMMQITIEFNRQFDGIIYSKGYYSNLECRYVTENSGKIKYVFTVSLNSCGTEFVNAFDTLGQSYLENVLVIQNEPGVQEVWDTIRAVRCLWEGNLKETLSVNFNVGMLAQEIVTFSGDTAMARLDIQLGRGPFAPAANGLVKIGEMMTLVVSVTGDAGFDIQVKECRAKDTTGENTILLTDDNGCVLKPKLFGAFQKTRNTGNTGANIIAYAFFNAFKFPDMMDLILECNIELCKADCEVCPNPNQPLEPGRRRRRRDLYSNETLGDPVLMGKKLSVILPEDLSTGEAIINLNQNHNICMSTQSFILSSVILTSLLVASSVISAYMFLAKQRHNLKQ